METAGGHEIASRDFCPEGEGLVTLAFRLHLDACHSHLDYNITEGRVTSIFSNIDEIPNFPPSPLLLLLQRVRSVKDETLHMLYVRLNVKRLTLEDFYLFI